jgi:hypothetical protein
MRGAKGRVRGFDLSDNAPFLADQRCAVKDYILDVQPSFRSLLERLQSGL